eukprot:m.352531 g.352531  ORF g.352531 m.352531 type:complete len:569 (+) comp16549_c0_seq1:337-2043(+)
MRCVSIYFVGIFCIPSQQTMLNLSSHCAIVVAVVAAIAFVPTNALSYNREGMQPSGWYPVSRADEKATVKFHITLKHADPKAIVKKLHAVSDPRSSDYGNHWTREQLKAACQPLPGAIEAVTDYLRGFNVMNPTIGAMGDTLTVTAKVVVVEQVLNLKMQAFEHQDTARTVLRTLDTWTLPTSVAQYVDAVFGLHAFPVVDVEPKAQGLGANVEPNTLRSLYGITDKFSNNSQSSQALAEFQGQGYRVQDLQQFQSKYSLPNQPVRNVTGDGQTSIGHTEANLDVQYIMVTGQLVPTDFWIQAGNEFDLLAWSQDVAANPNSALVWSVSYGEDIETIVQSFDNTYPQRFNTEVAKLGTLGISVLFASGDSGVYSRQSLGPKFRPDFPASLPAITGVGATQLDMDGAETTGTSFSGGGFCLSQYFQRSTDCPYQADAAEKFFNVSTQLPPADLYDAQGCGYPDVSAQGVNFMVVVNGIAQPVSGTSAACPTFAGVVALLNDQRMSQGKSPLGWLNPFLYQNPTALNDMQKGYNHGSGFHGFYAVEGWDPVTGLGTPNYAALKSAALNAP